MTLVIMAAGMGSRFGGLKQIEPVGPNGEFIIDYSIYDAIRAGFTKVVFIIKEENYDLFRSTIGSRIEGKIEVEYVFQKNDNIPEGIEIPATRVKPLGTGHAILCCKDVVNEPFLIINADDFYGFEAYEEAGKYLMETHKDTEYALIGYRVVNTLTENGSVKRGVCEVEGKYLTTLIESSVERKDGKMIATPLDGTSEFVVPEDSKVSMNMFLFYPNIFSILEREFKKFLTSSNDLEGGEFLIPEVVFEEIKNHEITCEVLDTKAVWKGITYPDDLAELKSYIKGLIDKGEYPNNLY